MLIGEKIREERLRQGLKQIQLARKSGVSNGYLADMENGRVNPSIKSLAKVAKALEKDVAFFVNDANILGMPDD